MSQDWHPPHAVTADTLDEIHGALSHRRRRCVIYELCQTEQLSVPELTDRLLEWDVLGSDNRNRSAVLTSLQHTHLPVLEHANVVEYDSTAQSVRLAPTGQQAEQIRRLAITQAQK